MGSNSPTSGQSAAGAGNLSVTCRVCGSETNELVRFCPTCQGDLGAPNVRIAMVQDEVDALASRLEAARSNAVNRGVEAEFDSLLAHLSSASHVVVAMPLLCARLFFEKERQIYANYEKLVGAGIRMPAQLENDADRRAVGGRLFGSFAKEICYGVLSLDGTSLANYGLVFVRLRDVAIKHRVSFLHENSYLFVDQHDLSVRGGFPQGYLSGWHNRGELAATKMEPMLKAGSGPADWARELVVQGEGRSNDMCVEAHIYGGFDVKAFEDVQFAHAGKSREERTDIKLIKERWAEASPSGGAT